MPYRMMGIVFVLIGLGMAYVCVLLPIDQATAHAPQIDFYWKGAILCPLAIMEGCVFLILGDDIATIKDEHGRLTRAGNFILIVFAISFIAGMLLTHWLQDSLYNLGYNSKLF